MTPMEKTRLDVWTESWGHLALTRTVLSRGRMGLERQAWAGDQSHLCWGTRAPEPGSGRAAHLIYRHRDNRACAGSEVGITQHRTQLPREATRPTADKTQVEDMLCPWFGASSAEGAL